MTAAIETREARHGRPRDPHVDTAIRQAALDLLVEEGFARMSMEGVASRAGVGKAAIYRRWDSKTALVVESIHDLVSPHLDWPQTDDIRADLEVIFALALGKMRGVEGELMAAVVSELVRNPELAATVRAQFVGCRKEDLLDRIREAIDDGQLPAGDAELLAEVGFAVIHHRMLLSDAPLSDDLPKRLVEQFFPRD
ncbi:MAG: TetR/AcrR family transcriptional regulator [Actinomycetota bacterium]|nr:TetR/AcrR family transcriptional regulator [Actinomycetota bacterium]MDQ6947098.1 TetR/AcrR family transcriptional regulator [Actinomycetota bacterium]